MSTSSDSPKPLKGFVSYATVDGEAVDTLMACLHTDKQGFDLDIWRSSGIAPGSQWDSQIMAAIEAADVFIVCVSPAFLASRYCYEVELPAIRRRARETGALVLAVLLEPCAWWGYIDDWQVVPTLRGKATPIANWRPPEKGARAAVTEMRQAIEVHLGLAPPEPVSPWPTPLPLSDLDHLGPGRLSPAAIQDTVMAFVARRKAESDA